MTTTTAQVAEELGTDSRTFRKFLRSDISPFEPVGQGSRYVFPDDLDIAALKKTFADWSSGRRSSTTTPTGDTKRSPVTGRKPRAARAKKKADPLEGDSPMTRLTSTIADRQRAHGIICNHSWPHPTVRGLTVKCKKNTETGSHFCKFHPQLMWCGEWEPVPGLCGPSPELKNCPTGKPYCEYHNGDISEEEFEKRDLVAGTIYDAMGEEVDMDPHAGRRAIVVES